MSAIGRAASTTPLPYHVIEVNPRVSRSSALASKATGYPIARVAAKIAFGKTLARDRQRRDTAARPPRSSPPSTTAWSRSRAGRSTSSTLGDRTLGTQMKATGEVMAIDRSFEAALKKAVRSLEVGGRTLLWENARVADATELPLARHRRAPVGADGRPPARRRDDGPAHDQTASTRGSSSGCATSSRWRSGLLKEPLHPDLLRAAKRNGFSDEMVGQLADRLPEQIRALRDEWDIRPVYKMVDTCAGEFDAVDTVLLQHLRDEDEAPPIRRERCSGYRQRVQSASARASSSTTARVHAAWALQKAGVALDHGQLQPRDRLHRFRYLRPPLFRAARLRNRSATFSRTRPATG